MLGPGALRPVEGPGSFGPIGALPGSPRRPRARLARVADVSVVDFSFLQDVASPRREAKASRAAARFIKLVDDEIYESDVAFLGEVGQLDIEFQKRGAFIPVAQYSGRTELTALRSWSHIRRKSADHFSIWYPAEGWLTITQYGRTIDLQPGEFAVTYADEPFRIRNRRGEGQHCRSYHVFVPSYILYGTFPEIRMFCARRFQADAGQAAVARELFMSLFREAERLPPDFEMACAAMAVRASAEAIREAAADELPRPDAARRRIEHVLRFIDLNLEDPELSAERVAKACGVSVRYLHHLMRRDGKTYRAHVRSMRLERAMRLLMNPQFDRYSITEIAYRLGFKSGNHFSQAFRRRFASTPFETRRVRAADVRRARPAAA